VSELVGLLKYLNEEGVGEPVERISYWVADKDGEWAGIAEVILEHLDTEIEIGMDYRQLDVADPKAMESIELGGIDMVIMSYVMSELCMLEARQQIAMNFRSTLAGLSAGSKILFLDSKHPLFINYFRSCKQVEGLEERNDDGNSVCFDLPQFPPTHALFQDQLDSTPRTELNAVSKLIVKANV